MPHGGPRANSGGKRPGAGRKPGSVWKPTVSEWRTCAARCRGARRWHQRSVAIFNRPRTFDETLDIATRVGCAAIATRYLHPTLSASSVAATHTVVKVDPGELLNRIAERIGRLAPDAIEHEMTDPPAAPDDQAAA